MWYLILTLPTASGMTLGEITKETFPLETLGTKLRGWSRDLHYTTPVVILRGLRLEGYSNEELVALQTGISSYIGNRRGVQTGSEEEDKKVLRE